MFILQYYSYFPFCLDDDNEIERLTPVIFSYWHIGSISFFYF